MVYDEDTAADQVATLIDKLAMRRGTPRRRLKLSWAESPVTHPLDRTFVEDQVEQKVIDLVVRMHPRIGRRATVVPAAEVMGDEMVLQVIADIVELGALLGVEETAAA